MFNDTRRELDATYASTSVGSQNTGTYGAHGYSSEGYYLNSATPSDSLDPASTFRSEVDTRARTNFNDPVSRTYQKSKKGRRTKAQIAKERRDLGDTRRDLVKQLNAIHDNPTLYASIRLKGDIRIGLSAETNSVLASLLQTATKLCNRVAAGGILRDNEGGFIVSVQRTRRGTAFKTIVTECSKAEVDANISLAPLMVIKH